MRDKLKENIILDKSFDFAVKIVDCYKYLRYEKKEYVLSMQLLKSGTSIGANINEAQAAQSRSDFLSKMSIASKEARETKYWLNLLTKTDYLSEENQDVKYLFLEVDNIINILTKIIKTGKK